MGEMRYTYEILVGKPDHLKGLSADGRIMIN
jgi:hypothetical protein